MARAQLNPAISLIRGQFGRLVFRVVRGKQVINQAMDYAKRRRNANQKASSTKFGQASRWAKAQLDDPQQRPGIERRAKRKGLTPRGYLIKEYYRAHP